MDLCSSWNLYIKSEFNNGSFIHFCKTFSFFAVWKRHDGKIIAFMSCFHFFSSKIYNFPLESCQGVQDVCSSSEKKRKSVIKTLTPPSVGMKIILHLKAFYQIRIM